MDFQADLFTQEKFTPINPPSTNQLIKQLKDAGEDHQWYPTTEKQLSMVAAHITKLFDEYDVTSRYSEAISLLDVGAGTGSSLDYLSAHLKSLDSVTGDVKRLAIEKSTIHINSYRQRNITLIGTEFNEVNFISKSCDFGFVNPPYKYYIAWLVSLLSQLNFKALYAVIPSRWKDSETIKHAINRRGVTNVEIIGESHFLDAERKARVQVDVVCFYFGNKPTQERINQRIARNQFYKPMLGAGGDTTFQTFIENELGLVKTNAETTNKFHEFEEKARIRRAMTNSGSECYEIVRHNGVLAGLLDNYERDIQNVLEQYKKIASLSGDLLGELGVDYSSLQDGIKEKLYGFRAIYWQLLFENLDAISSRLTSKHKIEMLDTLNSNALDFTEKNAIYIISYAIEIANENVDKGLVEIYKKLTDESSIKRYYKSNLRLYNDDWRYNCENTTHEESKRILDYRFVYSSQSNFHTTSSGRGLKNDAREFVADIKVIFTLMGYSQLKLSCCMDNLASGNMLAITGTLPNSETITLITIRFYKETRHLKFNQQAMLRFNCTVAQILKWVRNKEEFESEIESEKSVPMEDWSIASTLYLTPNHIPLLGSAKEH